MPAKYFRAFLKGNKNGYRDAEAIPEAVQRPTMRFVATKTAEQLDLQALHWVRSRVLSTVLSVPQHAVFDRYLRRCISQLRSAPSLRTSYAGCVRMPPIASFTISRLRAIAQLRRSQKNSGQPNFLAEMRNSGVYPHRCKENSRRPRVPQAIPNST
ncbi:MAG: hypothetical protein J2P51_06890 [Hyphomicrobiaceae bacterium]|nr:hypothetical protein [Hyphomicrobiaceae bacterium]